MTLVEAAYFSFLAYIGLALTHRALPAFGPTVAAGVAFSIASVTFVCLDLTLAALQIPFSFWTWAFTRLLVLLTVTWWLLRNRQVPSGILRPLAIISIIFGLAALAQEALNFIVATHDSFIYITLAQYFSASRYPFMETWITNHMGAYPPFLWIAHSGAAFLGRDFLTLLAPALLISLAMCVGGFVWRLGEEIPLPWRLFFSIVIAAVLVSPPQVGVHAFYIMPNLPAAALVTVGAISLWHCAKPGGAAAALPAAVALSGLILVRHEGAAFASIFLLLLATSRACPWRVKMGISLSVLVVGVGWFGVYLCYGPAEGDILSARTLLGLSLMLLAGVAANALSRIEQLHRPAVGLAWLMPAFLVTAIGLGIWFDPGHGIANLSNWATNLVTIRGIWGPSWVFAVLLVFLLAVAVEHRQPFERLFLVGLLSLVALTVLMGHVRSSPYRLGDQDSGNRIMLQIWPLVWLYVGMKLSALASLAGDSRRVAIE